MNEQMTPEELMGTDPSVPVKLPGEHPECLTLGIAYRRIAEFKEKLDAANKTIEEQKRRIADMLPYFRCCETCKHYDNHFCPVLNIRVAVAALENRGCAKWEEREDA